MANGDAERTIRHSLLERPSGRNPRAPETPSADRPRCPIAPCRASKVLKMLKTTRASYWLELASIWDRRHVRLGSAPPRLRRRYARNDGKTSVEMGTVGARGPRQVASLVCRLTSDGDADA